MRKHAKHLIVISYDAFSEDNWDAARKLPHLARLIEKGVSTSHLKSIYPTLTYVVHTTMVTGVYPDRHGIYHNNPVQPFVKEADQAWFWYKHQIQAPAIYDAVKENQLKSAGLLWPVTGKTAIHYNMPEIRAIGKENQMLKILKNGSPFYCIQMEKKFGHIRHGIEEPYLDDFTTRCAVDTIKRKRPNLLLMHLIDLDDAKHHFGTRSPEVNAAIIRMDQRIGEIIAAVEDAGLQEETAVIVVGDHGQLDVHFKVRLNTLLKEKGLIIEKNGNLIWRAYAQSCGGSAYLHLRKNDTEAEQMLLALFENAIATGQYGIEAIYDKKALSGYHAGTDGATYMIEAKRGYSFDDRLEEPVLYSLKEADQTYATHGYSPDKPGYRCCFVASGPGIKKNFELPEMEMVDIAPTMAEILGIPFYECDGRILTEIMEPAQ